MTESPRDLPRTRVVAIDDHPAILDAIDRAVTASESMTLVGVARDRSSAERLIADRDPDVVVCDVQLGGNVDGLRLLERFGGGQRPIFLMLSAYDYPSLFRAAHERGAAGYLLKTADLRDVVEAIERVAGGTTVFTTADMRRVNEAPRRPSEREIQVLDLVASGATNDEIGERLVLSLKTVESHLRRLFDRYGAMNRTELAVLALREGWIGS
jgi:DNA-binding NarL/FixJ family response regulator